MPLGVSDIAAILPVLVPLIDKNIEMLVELADHVYALHEKGTDAEINSLGARVSVRNKINPNYGNNGIDGKPFREPGQNNYLQYVISFVADNYSGGITGASWANLNSAQAFGDSVNDMIATGIEYMKRQRDIDFCHGSFPTAYRAKVLSVTSGANAGSVVVMDPEEGNRFLDKDGIYIFCHPTTGLAHGVATGHQLTSKTDNQITNFLGDVTSGTTAAAGDILVNRADATGASSFNQAIYGFEYFGLDSGDYFGLSKDTEDKIRGLREPGNGNNVSRSLLLRGEVRFKYRWNPGEGGRAKLSALVDIVSSAQYAIYETMGYNLTQYLGDPNGGPIKKFDAKINAVQDGGRLMIEDSNVRPSNWFRYDPRAMRRYVFEPTALWTKDGLKMRSLVSGGVAALNGMLASGGQIQDLLSWVIQGKEQMFYRNPALMITYFGLGTIGTFQGVA